MGEFLSIEKTSWNALSCLDALLSSDREPTWLRASFSEASGISPAVLERGDGGGAVCLVSGFVGVDDDMTAEGCSMLRSPRVRSFASTSLAGWRGRRSR